MAIIGNLDNSGFIKVYDDNNKIVEFNLKKILGNEIPKKIYNLEKKFPYISKFSNLSILNNFDFHFKISKILRNPSVSSKRFLTNKVDRSVTGLIAQQQCVGPLHTPLCDYSLISQSYFNYTGIVTSIGEKPIIGMINVESMVRMSIGEMITNMMFCKIDNFDFIRISGNWMWPLNCFGEKERLFRAVHYMCDCIDNLNIALDGGKDSLSMLYHDNNKNEIIKSPGTLVISGYTTVSDIRKKITPDFKNNNSLVYYINLSNNKFRLGGSIYYQEFNLIGDNSPNLENEILLKNIFNIIQNLIDENIILSGHDISDGGFITTLLEMCFSGNKGFKGNFNVNCDPENFLFSEELGIIIEVDEIYKNHILNVIPKNLLYFIGYTISENIFDIELNYDNGNEINVFCYKDKITNLRKIWEETSRIMDKLQTDINCIDIEYDNYEKWDIYSNFSFNKLTNNFEEKFDKIIDDFFLNTKFNINLAIIRDEGSNGDREMAAAFYEAGFNVYDYCMNDFINKDINLDIFNGIVFVGGFTYSDVLGAGWGWYQIIKRNKKIKEEFKKFYERNDTFSLGVCNGCQLMSLLGWIPSCKLLKNDSQRFESRYSRVKIAKSNSIMLKDMENNILGIWNAHGEGKFKLDINYNKKNIALQYVDYNDNITMKYPCNPNGSQNGIARIFHSYIIIIINIL
jgi:phosphoribosylformylglycinamidine synthase